jgi:hypothetical protein
MAAITGIWFVVNSHGTPNNILIQVQPEGQVDLLCDSRAAEAMVASFHFEYGIDNLPGWSFGSRFAAPTW